MLPLSSFEPGTPQPPTKVQKAGLLLFTTVVNLCIITDSIPSPHASTAKKIVGMSKGLLASTAIIAPFSCKDKVTAASVLTMSSMIIHGLSKFRMKQLSEPSPYCRFAVGYSALLVGFAVVGGLGRALSSRS